jgi:hypothetical protein
MKTSKSFVKPSEKLTFNLEVSRLHLVGYILLTAVLFLALFNFPYGLYCTPLVIYWACNHYYQHFGWNSVSVLIREPNGLWTINDKEGFELLSSSSIRRYWAVLYFKPSRVVAVFPDSIGEFRRLRVVTKQHRARQPDPSPNQY